MGHLGTCPYRLPIILGLVHLSKSDSQFNYPLLCSLRDYLMQMSTTLTALSISTALVTKLLVIEHLLHPAKFAVSAP